MSRKSAGRPKKAGARKPCGRLAPVNDNGTDEILLQRVRLVDENEAGAIRLAIVNSSALIESSDNEKGIKQAAMQLSATRKKLHTIASDRRLSYALGLLYARKHITGAQHYAGTRYAGLYLTSSYRAVRQQSVLGKMIGGGNGSAQSLTSQEAETAQAEQREAYLKARKILIGQGFIVANLVDSVCVFEQLPLFKQIDKLCLGLSALRDYFEAEGRKR